MVNFLSFLFDSNVELSTGTDQKKHPQNLLFLAKEPRKGQPNKTEKFNTITILLQATNREKMMALPHNVIKG